MDSRADQIVEFLETAGWGTATRAPLAGDASNRRYERLTRGVARAVLMDAPPERGEDVRPFVAIARHLSALGLSAPTILAQNPDQGFLLIEDLGDDLFARRVAAAPADEQRLYSAATDVLVALHHAPLPVAPQYGSDEMCETAALAPHWYGDPARTDDLRGALQAEFAGLAPWSPVLVLRDYHAENLLWLPDRPAPADVGLLDFQDAGIGHPAYDLMSLARDARRDVDPRTAAAMIDRYAGATAQDPEAFALACAVVSAQRNLRILGVFARLSLHYGKPAYVDLIPRVWRNLMTDLAHPGLDSLRRAVTTHLPPPVPSHLDQLKARCATILHPS